MTTFCISSGILSALTPTSSLILCIVSLDMPPSPPIPPSRAVQYYSMGTADASPI